MIPTRRQWLQAAAVWVSAGSLRAARKDFWESKDPARWSDREKQDLLWQSPWAREGFARMEEEKPPAPNGSNIELPDTRPGVPPGGVKSFPIGKPVPPAPKPGGAPVQFPVVARWETAAPVRLAGAPEVPELTGQFYVIRVHGLPLMPTSKTKDSNEAMLEAIKTGSQLERAGKAPIPCEHLFAGSGSAPNDVLLFFPRGKDPITMPDRFVTLDCRFAVFYLSVKFVLRDMTYRGQLAL